MAASPTYTYTFKVEPQMFRRALYFNTFGKQRIQSVIIAAMAVMGVGMLLANLVFHVEMTSVMQLCYIVIIAAVPLLLFSCEHSYRDYKKSPLADAVPRWLLTKTGLSSRLPVVPTPRRSSGVKFRQSSSLRSSSLSIAMPILWCFCPRALWPQMSCLRFAPSCVTTLVAVSTCVVLDRLLRHSLLRT